MIVVCAGVVMLGLGASASLAFGAEDLWSLAPEIRDRILRLRLPRTLAAALVGLNLAVSGVLLQAVLRNALAAPNIVGVTAGASVAATISIILFPQLPALLPYGAFLGALGAGLLVYGISFDPKTGTSPVRMVLGGIAVTAMLGAITTYLLTAYPDRAPHAILWLSGSLNGTNESDVVRILIPSAVGLVGAMLLFRHLDTLQLGDDVARSLGVRVGTVRFLAIALASLLAASAVSVGGVITFVGLVVPHVARMLGGSRHAGLIPSAAVCGAALLVWSDLGARVVQRPAELPVGMITALIGGPYFVFLLFRSRPSA